MAEARSPVASAGDAAAAGGAANEGAPRLRAALRKEYRTRRRAVPAAERAAAAEAAARLLRAAGLPRPRSRIGVYVPADGEFDPGPLIRLARRRGCLLYVPVVTDARAHRLAFAPLDAPAYMWRRNRYGIAEPGVAPRLRVAPRDLDLVLVPLVAFDAGLRRLGMGAGYYDRAYAYLRHRRAWRRPCLLGLAFDVQQAPRLPAAAWDVPLRGVLTGTRLLRTPVAETP